jgi:hypothetical protein
MLLLVVLLLLGAWDEPSSVPAAFLLAPRHLRAARAVESLLFWVRTNDRTIETNA